MTADHSYKHACITHNSVNERKSQMKTSKRTFNWHKTSWLSKWKLNEAKFHDENTKANDFMGKTNRKSPFSQRKFNLVLKR